MADKAQKRNPNIVLILADDMGYSDIGCFGGEVDTPNIDSLAYEGVRFTQMYNCARCCPSRASLLTGVYPHQAGVGHMVTDLGVPEYQGYLNRNCVTIAEALKLRGYQTLMSGKWHVGGSFDVSNPKAWLFPREKHPIPTDRGFDQFFGTLDGAGSFFNPHTLMRNETFIGVAPDQDFYYTDAISEEAVKMIRGAATLPEPFFLYLAYTAPHWPLHAYAEDVAKYQQKYMKGWDKVRTDRYDRMTEQKIVDSKWKISPRDENAPPWGSVAFKEWEDMRMAVYAAQIDRMDQGIGQVLAALRETGAEEDTLVMFMSDNGGCAEFLAENGFIESMIWPNRDGTRVRAGNFPGVMPGSEKTYMSYDLPWANASNTPFRLFKHWIHEGGIATPFVAKYPGVSAAGHVYHQPRHFVDVMATCIEAAGGAYPEEYNGSQIKPLEGESFLPALGGGEKPREAPVFWEHEGNQGVRDGEWKLVREYPGPWELYHFEEDRTELVDLSEESPDRVLRMSKAYNEWAHRCGIQDWDTVKAIAAKYYPGIR